MKQLLQSMRTGKVLISQLPSPQVLPGTVVVRTAVSLVSAGTERMAVEFAEKNLFQKARARPDMARRVLDKARREGVSAALEAVRNRLDHFLALGYSSAGTVMAVGEGVTQFRLGDRVACAGAGYAVHAEIVCVPRNLVVNIPEAGSRGAKQQRAGEPRGPGSRGENVQRFNLITFEEAAFTTVGAIALQGLRLAEPELGETVAVIGLGLIGLLTVQLAKAAGCCVLGMDPNPARCQLAEGLGCDATATTAEQMRSLIAGHLSSVGADAVIITAATSSNEPVEVAGSIARDRGRVVAVGAVGMSVPRKIYYEKELDFRISRASGPGRYDPEYEEKGHDYPIGYVRWTENRNMQTFVELLGEGKVDVKSLITHRFPIEEAHKTYDLITGKTGEPSLGVLITYSDRPELARRVELRSGLQLRTIQASRTVTVGMLGAGNFAAEILLPAMKQVLGIEFIGVCTATGLSARYAGDKFGFCYCTTDENEIFTNPGINTVVIATPHYLHARQVLAGLNAGKHVFCEKPLCLNQQELTEILRGYTALTPMSGSQTADRDGDAQAAIGERPSALVMVGYNRRFAPMACQLKAFVAEVHEPLVIHYRVNAGYIPPDHWVHDPKRGGGRIIGEVCHFVDFLTFLAGAPPVQIHARALPNDGRYHDDNIIISLEFANSSLGTITYVASGDKAFSKERVEVFGGGAVALLDDFRRLELVRHGHKKVYKSRLRQDKGHRGEWEAFVTAVRNGGPPPIPFEEILATTLSTFRVLDALSSGKSTEVDTESFITSCMTRGEKQEERREEIENPEVNP